jgi:hypothetical protein
MIEKIERYSRYIPETPPTSVVERLLDALYKAAEALEEHGDETTLPYILRIIRSVKESW